MKMVKHFSRRTLLAGIIAGCMQASVAQAGSLADIYQQALQHDPQLKSASASSLAGAEALPQAEAGLLPTLSLTGNATRTETTSRDFDNYGYTVSLSQPVFDASAWYTVKRGEALSETAKLQFEQAQQNLIIRSVESYLAVLRAKNNLETSQAEERAIKRRLDQVNAQFDVGLIPITDVHEAQASYDNAKVARILAEGELDNSYEAIERLSGQSYADVDTLSAEYPIENLESADAQAWLEKAMRDNLDLKVAESNVEASRRLTQINRSGHLPTVSLTASHDQDKGNTLNDDRNETNQIGLTFSLPLYSGGSTSSQVRESQYRFDQALQDREDVFQGIKQDTRSLLRDISTDVLSVAARKQSIVSSEAALQATSEGFNVGTRNVVDVLQAEQNLFSARRDYANARFDYVQNLFRFKQVLGTLNPEDLLSLDIWMTSEINEG